jgi:hypothetical protein
VTSARGLTDVAAKVADEVGLIEVSEIVMAAHDEVAPFTAFHFFGSEARTGSRPPCAKLRILASGSCLA